MNALSANDRLIERLQELGLQQAVQQRVHRNLSDVVNLFKRIASAQNLFEHVYRDPPGNLIHPVGLPISVYAVIAAILILVRSAGAVLHGFQRHLEHVQHRVLIRSQLLEIAGSARYCVIDDHIGLSDFRILIRNIHNREPQMIHTAEFLFQAEHDGSGKRFNLLSVFHLDSRNQDANCFGSKLPIQVQAVIERIL